MPLDLTFSEPIKGVINFTSAEQANIAKDVRTAITALSFLRSTCESPDASKQSLYSALYSLEGILAGLCKVTQTELDSVHEREQRFAAIRAANMKVRELELALGQEVGGQALSAALGTYGKRLKDWWNTRGMGYVRSLSFNEWGSCDMELSCKPSSRWDDADKAAFLADLQAKGCVVNDDDPGHEELEDTPRAREVVLEIIKRDLPSAVVRGIDVRANRKGKFMLDTMRVLVKDLGDVDRLGLVGDGRR